MSPVWTCKGAAALVKRLQDFLDREFGDVDVRETVLGHVVRGGNPSLTVEAAC